MCYAMHIHNRYLRDMLDRMVEWYIGIKTCFSVTAGKHAKYFSRYLEPEVWEMYTKTYSSCDYGRLWDALFVSGDLFRRLALVVGGRFGFTYPHGDDERVTSHLKRVRELPRDATSIY